MSNKEQSPYCAMAPPTPVLVKDDLNRIYELDRLVDDRNCVLKSLTQYECSFDGGLVNCNPFKRVFKDCVLRNGKKQRIEITDIMTNGVHLDAGELKSFLNAKEKLRKLYEKELIQGER